MEFLAPGMMAFAAAAVVPVLLHLILRQTPRRVVFPALRFIRRRSQANRRRMRLKHLLLLLLRVAAVVVLALALARPSLRSGPASPRVQAPVSALLLLDTSVRMQYVHQSRTRLDQARELAHWLLKQLPQGSQVAVVDSSPTPPAFQLDLAAARKRLDQMELTPAAVPLAQRLRQATQLLEKATHPHRELYIFTDRAQWSWPQELQGAVQESLAALDPLDVFLVDVSAPRMQNTWLSLPELNPRVVPQNNPVRLRLQVHHHSDRLENKVVHVRLTDLKGQEVQALEQTLSLQPGEAVQVEFTLSGLEAGVYQGEVRLLGEDALAADDRRYFTFRVHAPPPVLLAASEPAEQKALYVQEAIAPTVFRLEKRARFQTQLVPLEQLGSVSLEKHRAVVLLDPFPLTDSVWRKLREYVEQGGRLWICLGQQSRPAQAMNTPEALALLPGPLLEVGRAPDGSVFLAPSNYEHPALKQLAPLRDQLAWDAFPVVRYWLLDRLASQAQVLIPYSNSEPALIERSLGQGVVMVLTTSLSDPPGPRAWNNLPTGVEPVPFFLLVNGVMNYLTTVQEEQLNWILVPELALRLELARSPGQGFRITYPNGAQEIRAADPRVRQLTLSALEHWGNYQIRTGSQPPEELGFSVNLDPKLSQPQLLSAQQLQRYLGAKASVVRTREQLSRQVRLGRMGRELYGPVVLMLVVLLAAEWVMANRFYGSEGPSSLRAPSAAAVAG